MSATVDGYPVTITDEALDLCDSPAMVNSDVLAVATIGQDGALVTSVFCSSGAAPERLVLQGAIDDIDLALHRISILGFSALPNLANPVIDSYGGGPLPHDFLKAGDRVSIYGKYGSTPGLVIADRIVLWHHSIAPRVKAFSFDVSHVGSVFYFDDVPISTDDATRYIGVEPGALYRYPDCSPVLTADVMVNEDGSPTAVTITETSMLPMC